MDLKEKIINIFKRKNQKLKDMMYLIIYIMFIFIILFTTAKIIKTKTNLYRNDLEFRWTNILSYDDMQYARNIYTEEKDYDSTKQTIINHPLIRVLGNGFAFIENEIFTNMNNTDHYYHIVFFQIIINIIGVVFLYKILREQYNLKNLYCFILLTIYELSTVTLLGTWIIDSFIISGTLLIMSYYYLNKQKLIPSIILGILVTGITISNCIAFALMAIFLLKEKKDIIKVGMSCIIGGILIFLILPYKDILINESMNLATKYVERYAGSQTGLIYFKMVFYNLLASPIFFVSLIHNEINELDSLKFDLVSSKIIIIVTVIFFLSIIYNIIKNIKNRNLLAALSVFMYNMILHAVIKFSLYEGTIYGLHFLFAEILMFALGFKVKNQRIRNMFIVFSVFILLIQLKYNMQGILNIIILLSKWK